MRTVILSAAAAIALLALGEPASSAELTGCLTKRGTLTNVAPGPRPTAPCSPQHAKRVSIPVVSGAGLPNAARVDSYSFWKELGLSSSFTEDEDVLWLGHGKGGFSASCYQVSASHDSAVKGTRAGIWPSGYQVIVLRQSSFRRVRCSRSLAAT